MLGRLLRPVTFLLLFVLLNQSSCCTIIGAGIGSSIDREAPDRQSDSLVRAGRQYAGLATEVTTRDGRVVVGAREADHELTGPELRELYLGLAGGSSAAPRLPLPGDTILISTGARRGWVRFDRFVARKPRPGTGLLDTTGVVNAVFDLSDLAAPMTLPWSSIDRVQWADSTRLDNPRLLLPVLAKIPVNPRIFTICTESGVSEEFRSWDVEQVEQIRRRTATTIGTFTGMGIDIFLSYLVVRSLRGLGQLD